MDRTRRMDLGTLGKKPSAFLPVLMSLAALAVMTTVLARFGVVRDADEGTAAHLWQLLMGGQVPIVAWFIVRWLPEAPRKAAAVLVLQCAAGAAAFAPVFLLGL